MRLNLAKFYSLVFYVCSRKKIGSAKSLNLSEYQELYFDKSSLPAEHLLRITSKQLLGRDPSFYHPTLLHRTGSEASSDVVWPALDIVIQ